MAEGLAAPLDPTPAVLRIEHPPGQLEVTVAYSRTRGAFEFHSAGLVCTARLTARGEVMVPESAWT